MKIYYLFLSFLFLLSCTKDKQSPSPTASAVAISLINLWELQKNISYNYTNGILGNADTINVPSNTYWIRFNSNNTFIEFDNMVAKDTGTYTFNNDSLSMILGADTTRWTTLITPTSLHFHYIEIDLGNLPDTIIYEAEQKFIKK
ncbi:MAG: hypothetical protein A3F72_12120 [Bacteroidetes bacterium RIFCSPLOWO2_12_FULL_35_15]|nr:MAG: hypothetical protein A3F72_12120 [Bacteroidetes bacterium RIFCSPLOWO2_12_FULL_35_15]